MSFNQFMYERSIQEQIDRKMCRPGWTWNKTLKECLPAAAGYPKEPDVTPIPDPVTPNPGPDSPDSGENDGNGGESRKISPNQAIQIERAMRQSQGLRPVK